MAADADPRVPSSSLSSRLSRGALTFTAASAASGVAGIGFVVLGSRWFGSRPVGALNVAVGAASIYTALFGGGASVLTYRMSALSVAEGARHWSTATLYRAVSSSGLIMAFGVLFGSRGIDSRDGWLFAFAAVTNYISEPSVSFIAGRRQLGLVSGLVVGQRVIPLAAMLAGQGAVGLGLSYFVGSCATSSVAVGLAIRSRERHGHVPFRSFLSRGWALGVVGLGDSIQGRGISVLLAILEKASLLNALAVPLSITSGLASLGYSALYPSTAILGSDKAVDEHAVRSFWRLTLIVAAAMLVGGLSLLFLVESLRISTIGFVPVVVLAAVAPCSVLGTYYVTMHGLRMRFAAMAVATNCGAVATVAMTALLCGFGAVGVAMAAVGAELARTCGGLFLSRRKHDQTCPSGPPRN